MFHIALPRCPTAPSENVGLPEPVSRRPAAAGPHFEHDCPCAHPLPPSAHPKRFMTNRRMPPFVWVHRVTLLANPNGTALCVSQNKQIPTSQKQSKAAQINPQIHLVTRVLPVTTKLECLRSGALGLSVHFRQLRFMCHGLSVACTLAVS